MKRKLLNLVVFSGLILALGCDVVDDPVVYYAPCDTADMDETFNVSTESTPTNLRKVFLEDYTGHTCGNCPQAGKKMIEMASTYGDQVVGIGVHAGYFAEPYSSGDEFRTDFRTPAGEEYFTNFNVISNPNGLVNRKPLNGKTVLGIDQWEAAIKNNKDVGVLASIKMSKVYNTQRRVDFLDINVTFDSTTSNTHKLIVMLTEDNIVDWQIDYSLPKDDQHVEDYVHKHVLRDIIDNEIWGKAVNAGSASSGDSFDFSYQYCVDESYDDAECHLVAVLYNTATLEVVQCEEISIQ